MASKASHLKGTNTRNGEVALLSLVGPKDAGIYCWLNTVTGKRYVGSAVVLVNRFRQHRRHLSRGVHHNSYLQRVWDKYGAGGLKFIVLEKCSPEECISREQFWIDFYRSAERQFGYNLCPVAGSHLGYKHSPEARQRQSAALMGHPVSAETRAKLAARKRGKKMSQEHREKTRAASTGRTHTVSDETRARLSMIAKARKPISDVTRAKLIAARKGRKVSDETKRRMSEAGFRAWKSRRARLLEAAI